VNEIGKVIAQLESQRDSIDRAIAALREISGPVETADRAPSGSPNVATRKRQISPEGRKRIAEATRKRWAARRAAMGSETPEVKAPVRKRTLSAEGRKRIVEATKRRWAAKRAADAAAARKATKNSPRSKKAA
jgi:hypothetical protein